MTSANQITATYYEKVFIQVTTLVRDLKQLQEGFSVKGPSGREKNTHFKHWNNDGATLRVDRGKELFLVDLRKMIFLHREDQSIQFSRKFYQS